MWSYLLLLLLLWFDCLFKRLLLTGAGPLLLSVTILLGGCGGGPRFLVFISLLVFDPCCCCCCCCCGICFFIIKRCDNSLLKSTAESFELLVLVFCGLPPAGDDGDSLFGDVIPNANCLMTIYTWFSCNLVTNMIKSSTYFYYRLALTLASQTIPRKFLITLVFRSQLHFHWLVAVAVTAHLNLS